MNYETISAENLSLSKEAVRDILRENNAEVLFTKKDGTKRLMKCTLQDDAIVPHEKKTERTVKTNDTVISVWDLEASGWRTINLNTIESVKVY